MKMLALIFNFCISILGIGLVSSITSHKHNAVFNLKDLMSNLSDCDVQIMHTGRYHSQLSLNELNIVSTTVFMPKYEPINLHDFSDMNGKFFPALEILNSRVSSCRLSVIFFPTRNKEDYDSYILRKKSFIRIASKYYLYYSATLQGKELLPNINVIINIVLTKLRIGKSDWFHDFELPLKYYVFIIIAEPGQSLKMCFPQKVNFGKDNVKSNISCLSEINANEDILVSLSRKQRLHRDQWCFHINIFPDITWTLSNTNQLDGKRQISEDRLISEIFFRRNISSKNWKTCILYTSHLIKFDAQWLLRLSRVYKNFDVIVTKDGGYQFLTCYTEPYISFSFYFTPFQSEVWIILGISISTLILTVSAVFRYTNLTLNLHQLPFCVWMFVLATLFEESGFMPSEIEKKHFLQIIARNLVHHVSYRDKCV